MKKFLSFLIALIFSFSGVFTLSAKQEALLSVFIDKPVFGENSSYRFLLEQIPFELEHERIILSFPLYFKIPNTIHQKDVILSKEYHPTSVEWVDHRNIAIEADFSKLKEIEVQISEQAGINNPIEWLDSSVFAMVFTRTDFVVISQNIQLRQPNNTVKLLLNESQGLSSQWYAEPISLRMASSVTKEIRFRINNENDQIYKEEFQLGEGIYEISYWGIRNSGAAESEKNASIRIDALSPRITLLSPKNNELTNQEKIEFKFQIEDISQVRILIQGYGEYLVPSHGISTIPVSLKPGLNVIQYRAIDEAGHSSEGSVQLMLDITPPYLNILSPRHEEIICTSRVDIVGKAEIDSQVWVGDIPVLLDRFGNFVVQWTPDLGRNQVLVRAVDRAGNETRKELQFLVYPGIVVEASLGKNTALVNGEAREMQPAPFVDRQTAELYFPLRFMAETLSYKLEWVPQGAYVSMKKDNWEIRIRSLDPVVQIRSGSEVEEVRLQYMPTIYQGAMMIPAEFIKRIWAGDLMMDPDLKKVIMHFCEKSGV